MSILPVFDQFLVPGLYVGKPCILDAMPGDTTLILGAGFSRPAGGPLLRDLLSKIRDVITETALTDGWGKSISPGLL